MTERASYDVKGDRAEHHFKDLVAAVGKYSDSHPYEIRERREGKKKTRTWRLFFTRQPGMLDEHEPTRRQRERWISYTEKMTAGAVTILKGLQPPDDGRDDSQGVDALQLLNRLSNTDRHSKLPVLGRQFRGITVGGINTSTGQRFEASSNEPVIDDGAPFFLHNPPMNLDVHATTLVFLPVGKGVGYEIINKMGYLLDAYRRIANLLRPFDRMTK